MNEAELVLSHVLNCDRLSLYLDKDTVLDKDKSVIISNILKRRTSGEPLQYILGRCEFMGCEFKVDQRAFIPRPETEILVESAIAELRAGFKLSPEILDLGTGSGCIAVSIAKLFPGAHIWAADISEEALQLAGENARLNKVEIKFLRTDLFSGLKNGAPLGLKPAEYLSGQTYSRPKGRGFWPRKYKKFDLIISNPPYIPAGELSGLAKEISFEPRQAVSAGTDGLDFYRSIISQSTVYLYNNGLLAFEVGAKQAKAVSTMLREENFSDIKIIKDYNNIQRVVMAKKRTG